MTDQNYRHVVIVQDRSASMGAIREATERGLNQYVTEQKANEGRATLTLVEFDTEGHILAPCIHTVYDFAPLETVKDYYLIPRGNTPLFDAVGITIIQEGKKLADLPEDQRPGLVIFVIITDGQENASREFNVKRVKEMIEHQQERYDWVFYFLAADQDAFETGGAMGVARGSTMSYASTDHGTHGTYSGLSTANTRLVKGVAAGQSVRLSAAAAAFTDQEREEALQDDE